MCRLRVSGETGDPIDRTHPAILFFPLRQQGSRDPAPMSLMEVWFECAIQDTSTIDEKAGTIRPMARWPLMFQSRLQSSKKCAHCSITSTLILAIALIDWHASNEFTFGHLYLYPMLIAGRVLNPWRIAAVAALCTFLAERSRRVRLQFARGRTAGVMCLSSFLCAGLFIYKNNQSRRRGVLLQRCMNMKKSAMQDAMPKSN